MKNLGLGCANSTQPCPSGCSGEGCALERWNHSKLPFVTWELCTLYSLEMGDLFSVAKKITCILPGWNSCFYRPLQEDVQMEKFFCICLRGRPRLLFLCGTFTRTICILGPDWWLVAVNLFWSGAPPLSAFLFIWIHGFGNTSNQVLLFSYSWVWEDPSLVCCLSFAPRLGAAVFLLTWIVTIHAVYSFLVVPIQLLEP